MKLSFGKAPPDPGYDPRADMDNNNSINIADFNLLKANYGFGGAPPIGPSGP